MTATNYREFALGLDEFIDKTVPEAVVKLKREIAIVVLEGVVLKSPVDTGYFRAQWTVSIGRAADGTIEQFDPTGAPTITRGLAVISQAGPGDDIHISNATVYGPRLEDGWSQQAPQGMVALTVAEVRALYGRAT